MDKKDISLIQELLKQCVESLNKDDLCPDHAVKLFVMARVNDLAQQACKITAVNLSKGDMASLRIHIIDVFDIRYSDCHESDEPQLIPVKKEPKPKWNSLYAACSILGMCYDLEHMNDADREVTKQCLMVEKNARVQEFIESVSSMRLDYDSLIDKLYNVW